MANECTRRGFKGWRVQGNLHGVELARLDQRPNGFAGRVSDPDGGAVRAIGWCVLEWPL